MKVVFSWASLWANFVLKSSASLKKGKGHFYLTSVVPSVLTKLLSMEANGAPSTPPATVSAGIQRYSYTDQRKVEADVEVTEDRTGDLSLRKPRTRQLSHDCL